MKDSIFPNINPIETEEQGKIRVGITGTDLKKIFKGTIPDYIDLRIIVGELVPTVLRIANNQNYDLIIIKKSKKIKGFFYNLRKHTTDRIIGASSCPRSEERRVGKECRSRWSP